MAYSVDLRMSAVKYYLKSEDTIEETAKIFGVGKTTLQSWVKRYKESGNLENKPLNRSFKKVDPEKLREYVRKHPDDTQGEIAVEFGCCNQAISKALKRLGITRKKRRGGIKSKTRRK